MPSTAYDSLIYDAGAHVHTHPSRLATMGFLLGLTPPSLYTARILEVGCATGTNLMAMAESYPDARFLGIDYAARQIEIARTRLAMTDLVNVELDHRSIGDITAADGKFDYIIAHGVYSWIPPDTQEALLRVCSSNLADNGVAYISYNTLPGWSMAGVVRDVMLFHTRKLPAADKIPAARSILEFLSKSSPADTSYGLLLRETSARLANVQDYYLAHEYLEAENSPVYFHDFVDRLVRNDLQYLAEVELSTMLPNFLPPDVVAVIGNLAKNPAEYEQYLDFLRARTFRQSLVVHASTHVHRQVAPERLASLHVFPTMNTSVGLADIRPDNASVRFTAANGQHLDSSDPTFKTIVRFILESAPLTLSVEDVVSGATRVDPLMSDADWRKTVLMRILEAFSGGIIRVLIDPPLVENAEIDERPKVSSVARAEASFSESVTIKGHMATRIDILHRQVVRQLDGTHTKEEIVQALCDGFGRGDFRFTDGTGSMAPELLKTRIAGLVGAVIVELRSAGLLRH